MNANKPSIERLMCRELTLSAYNKHRRERWLDLILYAARALAAKYPRKGRNSGSSHRLLCRGIPNFVQQLN